MMGWKSIVIAAVIVSAEAEAGFAQYDFVRLDPVAPVYVPPLRDRDVPRAAPTGFTVETPIRVVPGSTVSHNAAAFPGVQRELTGIGAPSPLVDFEGLSNDDMAAVLGVRVLPPDTNGAAGTTQYVQWVNLLFEVFDKEGNSLLGPFPANLLFLPCQNTGTGDPIVLFDQKNSRWVVTQHNAASGTQCVLVSQSADATGGYWAYAFNVQGFNDDAKMGLWLNNTRDALGITYRNFGGPGGAVSLDFHLIDYAPMLSGGSASHLIVRSGIPFLEGTLPANVDGSDYPAGDGALFGRINDDGTAFDIYELDADFPVGPPSFEQIASVPIGPIDRSVGRIPQPPPGEPLNSNSQFMMHRMTYRERGGFRQILATATADAGGDVGAKYWAELRDSGAGWSAFQEGLYSPGPQVGPRLERWMGSIAADRNGNIALGYSAASTASAPSVRYTGRMAADPPGTMRDEVQVIKGGGVQTTSPGWGDYSSLSVDPVDDCTFWYTNEYYANTGVFDFKTRIVAFRFGDCGTTPTAPTLTRSGGSCPGQVTIEGSGFKPFSEAAVIEAASLNGFGKGGVLCNGTRFEIGEPFRLPPSQVLTDGDGAFTVSVSTQPGFCFVEAIDLQGSCLTSGALDLRP